MVRRLPGFKIRANGPIRVWADASSGTLCRSRPSARSTEAHGRGLRPRLEESARAATNLARQSYRGLPLDNARQDAILAQAIGVQSAVRGSPSGLRRIQGKGGPLRRAPAQDWRDGVGQDDARASGGQRCHLSPAELKVGMRIGRERMLSHIYMCESMRLASRERGHTEHARPDNAGGAKETPHGDI